MKPSFYIKDNSILKYTENIKKLPFLFLIDFVNSYHKDFSDNYLKPTMEETGVKGSDFLVGNTEFNCEIDDENNLVVDFIDNSNVPRLFKLNYGGLLKPKNHKFMSIPLTKSKKSYVDFAKENGKNFSMKSYYSGKNGGVAYIAGLKSKGNVIHPYFLLLQKVTLKRREFIEKAANLFKNKLKANIYDLLRKELG